MQTVHRRMTPREAAWLLILPGERLTESQLLRRKQLLQHTDCIARIQQLTGAFISASKECDVCALQAWLREALGGGFRQVRNFAASIERDYLSFRAAQENVWNNGPTEGHVNRLKFIKRSMYGRAKLDLLRKRVLWQLSELCFSTTIRRRVR